MPEVVTGQPARNAICRAMLKPVAPSGLAQPMITSSTEAGSTLARSMAARTTCPPSVAPCVRLKAPRQDSVSAVRAVETMTASTTAGPPCFSLSRWVVEGPALGGEFLQQLRRFPCTGISNSLAMFVGGEFLHAPQDLGQAHAARMEHRAAAMHREAVSREVDHVDVGGAQCDALLENARALVDQGEQQPVDDFP